MEASGSSACRFLFQRKSLPLATRCSWHFARDRPVTPHDGENRATAWTGRGALGSRFACGRRPGAHGGPVPTGTTLPESAGSTRLPVRVSDACRALTRALGPGRRGWPLWARGPLSLTPCDPGPRAPGWTFRRPRGRFAWAAPKVKVPGPPRGQHPATAGGLSGPSARSRRAGVAAGCRALRPPRAPPQPGPAPSRSKDTQKPLTRPLGLPPAARGGRKARDSAVWSQDAAVAERPASPLAGLPGRLGSGQLHGKRPVPRGHGAVITGVETEAVRARARPEPKGTWASGEPCPVHRPESLAQPRALRGSARPCCPGFGARREDRDPRTLRRGARRTLGSRVLQARASHRPEGPGQAAPTWPIRVLGGVRGDSPRRRVTEPRGGEHAGADGDQGAKGQRATQQAGGKWAPQGDYGVGPRAASASPREH